MPILTREFYTRPATTVARELLGALLVREIDGQRVSGLIVETEAYTGLDDMASHGRKRRTPRNTVMYGAPGHAYVYFTYGMHWLLNAVCEPEDQPAAVLLRAIDPQEGQTIMAANRPGRPPREWTSGPARLAKALAVARDQNGLDLTDQGGGLWIEAGSPVPDEQMRTGPRIGLGSVVEPWLSMPWRFWIADNPFVSR
ncbi:MAG TPA: DNA-3-methyladenine glycosylase [Aggregatilinea sp.]|uniref:DNA-3-methyladenine glycosylase n=1 Tax=Aggregatilinea sp. TaxID=2806333 RepID=UPI002C17AF96|nr:DNA-3-methyladenine glycosylase [Aggregatilinea sp.]HML23643.1 DNA-3-methyladenine glycosylase [Aggregatilinea sp.]